MQPHNFFSTDATPGTPTRRHALGRLPTPPPLPENLLLGLHRKLPSEPPASTQEVSESENRPATRGTAHSEVQGDARCTTRCTARCNVRPMAALHFLPPTGHSPSGSSFDSKLISLPRSTRFPFTSTPSHPASLAIRKAPNLGGLHITETNTALRSRKTKRAAKEKPTPISQIFKAPTQRVPPQLARHALGRLPTPPPLPENLLLGLHRKLPSEPPASTQEVSESEVPVHVHPFAARVPSDSKGSECQCGIHTAEAASALRSRKTQRAAKEKPMPTSNRS